MNSKIISIKTTSTIFLAIVLITGTFAISLSFMINAQAQPYYYGIDNNYEKLKDSKSNTISINKIKCINDNININGVNSGNISIGNKKGQGYLGANSYGSEGYYDGYDNNKQGKGFDDCIVNNNNNNTNVVSTGGAGNVTIPPQPEPEPESTTATLTVKKQVFGCNNFQGPSFMNCTGLPNNSSQWLNCNNNPLISGTVFCQSLPESIFDIEVLDDQNSQIQEFEGSEQGTTIQNLEPGTYTVNEIEQPELNFDNQLSDDPTVNVRCSNQEFPDGGYLINATVPLLYQICFEYEDEQGNDCSTITLAAGESRTCIVKNYISAAGPPT